MRYLDSVLMIKEYVSMPTVTSNMLMDGIINPHTKVFFQRQPRRAYFVNKVIAC